MSLELLTIGRVSVDLYADEAGAAFTDPQHFSKSIGGTATNVAVAAARLGRRAAVFTKVGSDPFGDYVIAKLDDFGVDTRFVGRDERLRTPLAFAALTPPEDPELLFYREPEAPDMQLRPDDIDAAAAMDVPVLWVAGSAVADDPARRTIHELLTQRERRRHVIVDLDYRPMLWHAEREASAVIGVAVGLATTVIGNREECRVAVGTDDADEASDRLLERGVEVAVVKLGGDGVMVATADERTVVPPRPVEVVCGLGAGDAFGGAYVHALLAGRSSIDAVAYGNAAGAIVAGRLLCADAMPTADEIDEKLGAR